MPDKIVSRVLATFPHLLGGPWSPNGEDACGRWVRHVAHLRNRIAHSGYVPSERQIQLAQGSVDGLVSFICDRLAHDSTRNNLPRTATALAGISGLEKRGKQTKVAAVQSDAGEPVWADTFARWRAALDRLREDRSGGLRAPSLSRAELLLISVNEVEARCCLHDPEVHLATYVEPLSSAELEPLIAELRSAGMWRPIGLGTSAAISVLRLPDDLRDKCRIDEAWVEEYQHVPELGVMVDRTDYRCQVSGDPPPAASRQRFAPSSGFSARVVDWSPSDDGRRSQRSRL